MSKGVNGSISLMTTSVICQFLQSSSKVPFKEKRNKFGDMAIKYKIIVQRRNQDLTETKSFKIRLV